MEEQDEGVQQLCLNYVQVEGFLLGVGGCVRYFVGIFFCFSIYLFLLYMEIVIRLFFLKQIKFVLQIFVKYLDLRYEKKVKLS